MDACPDQRFSNNAFGSLGYDSGQFAAEHFKIVSRVRFLFQSRILVSLNCRPELPLKKKQKAENIKRFGDIFTKLLDACERNMKM